MMKLRLLAVLVLAFLNVRLFAVELVVNGDMSSDSGWTIVPPAGMLPQYSLGYANIGASGNEGRIYRKIGTIDASKTYTFTASLATRVYDSAGYMSSNPAVLYSSAYITVLNPVAVYAVATLQASNSNTSIYQDPTQWEEFETTYTPNPAHNGMDMYVVWQGWFTGSWGSGAGLQASVDNISVTLPGGADNVAELIVDECKDFTIVSAKTPEMSTDGDNFYVHWAAWGYVEYNAGTGRRFTDVEAFLINDSTETDKGLWVNYRLQLYNDNTLLLDGAPQQNTYIGMFDKDFQKYDMSWSFDNYRNVNKIRVYGLVNYAHPSPDPTKTRLNRIMMKTANTSIIVDDIEENCVNTSLASATSSSLGVSTGGYFYVNWAASAWVEYSLLEGYVFGDTVKAIVEDDYVGYYTVVSGPWVNWQCTLYDGSTELISNAPMTVVLLSDDGISKKRSLYTWDLSGFTGIDRIRIQGFTNNSMLDPDTGEPNPTYARIDKIVLGVHDANLTNSGNIGNQLASFGRDTCSDWQKVWSCNDTLLSDANSLDDGHYYFSNGVTGFTEYKMAGSRKFADKISAKIWIYGETDWTQYGLKLYSGSTELSAPAEPTISTIDDLWPWKQYLYEWDISSFDADRVRIVSDLNIDMLCPRSDRSMINDVIFTDVQCESGSAGHFTGDIDQDCMVNNYDLLIFVDKWLEPAGNL